MTGEKVHDQFTTRAHDGGVDGIRGEMRWDEIAVCRKITYSVWPNEG